MRNREQSLHVRLNNEEMQLIRSQAKKAGLNVRKYLIAVINNRPVKERPSMDFIEILHQLRMIGNNLNQVAKVANAKGFVDTEAYWNNVKMLQESIGILIRGMYG